MRVCREVRKGFLEKGTLKWTLMCGKEFSRQREWPGGWPQKPRGVWKEEGGAGPAEMASGGMWKVTVSSEGRVEQWPHLMQTSVLNMVGGHLLLPFDLHTDVQPDGTGHSRFVGPLVCRAEGEGCQNLPG